MINQYSRPPINAFVYVSAHLAKWFQRGRFLEIDQSENKLPMAAMFVNEGTSSLRLVNF
jgi:hypothetical protein